MNRKEQLIEKLTNGSLKGIIFDFDGTLLDISEPLSKSIQEVYDENHIQFQMESTIQEIGAVLETIQAYPLPQIILQSFDIVKYVESLNKLRFLKKLKIATKIFSKFLSYSKEAPFFPDSRELVTRLDKLSDLFIVSHSKKEKVEEHLKKEGISEYFKGIYGTDDLPELKPSPLAFQPILDSYKNQQPEDFLMIGDMPSDLEAGQNAGFWTIGIASGISKKQILADWEPDLLVDSLKELNNLMKGSQISKTNNEIKIKTR